MLVADLANHLFKQFTGGGIGQCKSSKTIKVGARCAACTSH
jgi:hypothetical protein